MNTTQRDGIMQRWNIIQYELIPELRMIDHNPRKGEKIEFTASEAQRYKERSQAERTNASLKDDYGGRFVRVRGNSKVMSHLIFGMLALTAHQLMRLLT
jgi:hypothetical protein